MAIFGHIVATCGKYVFSYNLGEDGLTRLLYVKEGANSKQESRAFAWRTTRCRYKFRYLTNFSKHKTHLEPRLEIIQGHLGSLKRRRGTALLYNI